jgi:hypothetical protein
MHEKIRKWSLRYMREAYRHMGRYDRKLLIAGSSIFFYMLFGIFVFHALEDWGFIDAFYFTGVTLTTIGYGDLYPVTAAGKVFVVLYALVGIGIVFYCLGIVGQKYFEREEERLAVIFKHAGRTRRPKRRRARAKNEHHELE